MSEISALFLKYKFNELGPLGPRIYPGLVRASIFPYQGNSLDAADRMKANLPLQEWCGINFLLAVSDEGGLSHGPLYIDFVPSLSLLCAITFITFCTITFIREPTRTTKLPRCSGQDAKPTFHFKSGVVKLSPCCVG